MPRDEVIHKSRAAERVGKGPVFVLSDPSIDLYGDIVDLSGWDTEVFKGTVPCLFNHNPSDIIGKWHDIQIANGRVEGRLELVKPGTSPYHDKIRSLLEQDMIPGVSVGFANGASEPLDATGKRSGRRYKRQRLLECSLVAIPANQNAVQIARSLGLSDGIARQFSLSDEITRLCFGEPATASTRGKTGEPASSIQPRGSGTTGMTTLLSARIEAAQTRLNGLKDQLTEHTKVCDDVMTEAEIATMDDLNSRIDVETRQLDSLHKAERNMAQQAAETLPAVSPGVYARANGGGNSGAPATLARPFAAPAEKVEPGERYLRSIISLMHSRASNETPDGYKTPAQVYAQRWGEDGKVDEHSRLILDHVTRAASAPADTTTSGWASQLVRTDVRGFLDLLQPASVYPGLSSRGQRLSFGTAGQITIPTWATTPTIAGSFVAEGAAIPVRQGALSSISLGPKKMAVITTFTREIMTYSNPTIQSLVTRKIQDDTSKAIDTVLLDATAASSIRPAGIRNGVTVTTATAGGGFAALTGDLKALLGALITSSNGNLRMPTWIMNPVQAIAIALTQNAGGDFPFSDGIQQGRFQGYPVIQSTTVTAGMVILIDAADFVSVEGDSPMYSVSDQATLHMEDTTPLPIASAGSPNTVAAPVRSLYQTDSLALRMILPLNWALLRTGTVAWTQAVTW